MAFHSCLRGSPCRWLPGSVAFFSIFFFLVETLSLPFLRKENFRRTREPFTSLKYEKSPFFPQVPKAPHMTLQYRLMKTEALFRKAKTVFPPPERPRETPQNLQLDREPSFFFFCGDKTAVFGKEYFFSDKVFFFFLICWSAPVFVSPLFGMDSPSE